MGNDLMSYRITVGLFYCKVYSRINKRMLFLFRYRPVSSIVLLFILNLVSRVARTFLLICHKYIFRTFRHDIYFLLILLILILLGNDISENPGPEQEISVFHLNARSVRHKLSYIENICANASVLCITESHLDESVLDENIKIDGYQDILIRKDRNCFGGGVLVYISEGLRAIRREDLEFPNGELVWIELSFPRFKLLLCVVYRTHGAINPFWDNFQSSVEEALNISPFVVITGDLNVDLLRETNHRLNEIIQFYNLTNHISEPTRVDLNSGTATLLDPVLVSQDAVVLFSEVIDVNRTISDHQATKVYIKVPHDMNSCYKRTVWLYKHADFNSINLEIENYDWVNFFSQFENIDVTCKQFTEQILNIFQTYIPIKEIIVRHNDKPWFNSNLRREIRIRDRLQKKARTCQTEQALLNYKRHRNKVSNMKKYAKEQFFLRVDEMLDTSHSSCPKTFWGLVKKLTSRSNFSTIPPLIDPDTDEIVIDDGQKCNLLNKYFSSISSIDDTNHVIPDFPRRSVNTIDSIDITRSDVKDILQTLILGKATGHDGVSHHMLKYTADSISLPLYILFSKSLRTGIFPDYWKLATVMPSFKKTDKSLPSNYRPIALLSCVGKVFERVVYKYLYNFFITNSLLYKFQSGFLTGHSTVHQLIEIYNNICSSLNEKHNTCIVFCDISKAFDKVWHKGLIIKLRGYGVDGSMLEWIESYLSNRRQRVFIKKIFIIGT